MIQDTRAGSSLFVEVPNGRLYCEIAGNGPPVLLVHGFSLDTRMWDDQWAAFAQRFRVVRVDLRGFGRSESRPVPFDDMDDLVAVLDRLEIERVHIVGLSMGATVVVDFALAHPERINALVPVDGGPSGSAPPPPALQAIMQNAGDGRIAQAREEWLDAALFAPAMERPAVAARLREIVTDFTWWRPRHPGLARRLEPPALGRLSEIAAPTLVVVGDRERPAVRTGCDALVSGIRGARLVVLPGVGHMSNMEDPPAFNAAVLQFLESV